MALAEKGGVCVDVGTNYGYFLCLWAFLNPEKQVIAFEASPRNVLPLRKNIYNNNLLSHVDIYDK